MTIVSWATGLGLWKDEVECPDQICSRAYRGVKISLEPRFRLTGCNLQNTHTQQQRKYSNDTVKATSNIKIQKCPATTKHFLIIHIIGSIRVQQPPTVAHASSKPDCPPLQSMGQRISCHGRHACFCQGGRRTQNFTASSHSTVGCLVAHRLDDLARQSIVNTRHQISLVVFPEGRSC